MPRKIGFNKKFDSSSSKKGRTYPKWMDRDELVGAGLAVSGPILHHGISGITSDVISTGKDVPYIYRALRKARTDAASNARGERVLSRLIDATKHKYGLRVERGVEEGLKDAEPFSDVHVKKIYGKALSVPAIASHELGHIVAGWKGSPLEQIVTHGTTTGMRMLPYALGLAYGAKLGLTPRSDDQKTRAKNMLKAVGTVAGVSALSNLAHYKAETSASKYGIELLKEIGENSPEAKRILKGALQTYRLGLPFNALLPLAALMGGAGVGRVMRGLTKKKMSEEQQRGMSGHLAGTILGTGAAAIPIRLAMEGHYKLDPQALKAPIFTLPVSALGMYEASRLWKGKSLSSNKKRGR